MPCDTFVALPNVTEHQSVIFGKNSDRVGSEVQEVVHVPASDHASGAKVKCTYIEIAQTTRTHAVMLSKPCWMWGAEMGANEHGVCIGNEAVFTKVLAQETDEKRLLGMDLVRLGLERAVTAREAVEVMSTLLEAHGQGGPCFIDPSRQGQTYHNSFIIADPAEAWVLETAGKHWAAHQCTVGVRNISNELSIGTDMTLMSAGMQDYAKNQGWWDGSSPFSFKDAFGHDPGLFSGPFVPSKRFESGRKLLETKSAGGKFSISHMMEILRDEDAAICQTGTGPRKTVTTGSQVSVLYTGNRKMLSHHWFTATPNPSCSVFKPFLFVPGAVGSDLTQNMVGDNSHDLQKAHAQIQPLPGSDVNVQVRDVLRGIEERCVREISEFAENADDSSVGEVAELFKDSVDSEMKFYQF